MIWAWRLRPPRQAATVDRHLGAPACRAWCMASLVSALALPSAGPGLAAAAAKARPAAEFSRPRLDHISDFFMHEVAAEKIAGAYVFIHRHGRSVYLKTFRVHRRATKTPKTS